MTAPEPRVRRNPAALGILLVGFFGILLGLSVISGRFDGFIDQLELKVRGDRHHHLPNGLPRFWNSVLGISLLIAGVAATAVGPRFAADEPRLRARRTALCVLITSSAALFVEICVILGGFEDTFKTLQFHVLPAPTALLLALARLSRSVVGVTVLSVGLAAAVGAVRAGTADARMGRFLLAAVAATIAFLLLALALLALYMPLARVCQ